MIKMYSCNFSETEIENDNAEIVLVVNYGFDDGQFNNATITDVHIYCTSFMNALIKTEDGIPFVRIGIGKNSEDADMYTMPMLDYKSFLELTLDPDAFKIEDHATLLFDFLGFLHTLISSIIHLGAEEECEKLLLELFKENHLTIITKKNFIMFYPYEPEVTVYCKYDGKEND